MYVPFQNARLVPVQLEAGTYAQGDRRLPRLDAIAARAADGTLWLAVTNVDPNRAGRIDISVEGMRARSATGQVLTAPSVDSHNTFDAADRVRPQPVSAQAHGNMLRLDLPAKSVTVVRLSEGS
jgi:alpha-N-arabinofuranosidase